MAVWISQDQEKWMIAYIVTGILLFMGGISNAQAQTTAGKIVKYHATINDAKYVYGAAGPGGPPEKGGNPPAQTLGALGDSTPKTGGTPPLVEGGKPPTPPLF